MSRIFVEEDAAKNHENTDNGMAIDLEQLKINKTYTEALNQFLEPNQKPPRAISDIFRKKKPRPQQDEEPHQSDSQETQENQEEGEDEGENDSQEYEDEQEIAEMLDANEEQQPKQEQMDQT